MQNIFRNIPLRAIAIILVVFVVTYFCCGMCPWYGFIFHNIEDNNEIMGGLQHLDATTIKDLCTKFTLDFDEYPCIPSGQVDSNDFIDILRDAFMSDVSFEDVQVQLRKYRVGQCINISNENSDEFTSCTYDLGDGVYKIDILFDNQGLVSSIEIYGDFQ
ncbi:MAG: hypothetical protein HN413_14445 [Chloroflexi bacterium]|jgi:hypothetical protein|nr:hypothetical protein [Chloroflexota bacterium]